MNDKVCIDTLRCISLDMIDKANSGHPGTSLDAAPLIHTLFTRHMVANPLDPSWIKRDRFVMSCGHASSLLYVLLHLSKYNISLADLKNYKQFHSITPGHPEYKVTDGIDISTGPLGQGIANAVGMAMAERHLCALHPSLENVLSHYTYALCGDGCLEEGIGLEALAIAGQLKLSKLVILYDNNDVTLDGPLSQSCVDDMSAKVASMGFNVINVEDGNDIEAIDNAISQAKAQNEKPTMIICKTIIGYGSEKQGTCAVHGSPLKKEGSDYAKRFYGWNYPEFFIPKEVYDLYENTFILKGKKAYNDYLLNVEKLSNEDKETFNKILKDDVSIISKKYDVDYLKATRDVSNELLNAYSDSNNNLIGGSADVAASVKTALKNKKTFNASCYEGQNVNFGIREHAMCAIANGIAAHGGLRPYVGSFLVFSDYAKGALRMAAMMKLPVTYLFSHDSIAVGEDGPTHQPIEQVASMRLIPNFNVIRPADANETVGAYEVAFSSKTTPTAIILTRQNLKTLEGNSSSLVKKGAYILSKESKRLDAIIVATGSEVNLAYEAKQELYKQGIDVRVVSMPSKYLFELQDTKYQQEILPNRNITLAVEMGVGDSWYKYANDVMSIESFGLSAPFKQVMEEFNFTKEEIVSKIKRLAKNR